MLTVTVTGARGVASALERSGRFTRVVPCGSIRELRELVVSSDFSTMPKGDLLFIFAGSLDVEEGEAPLETIVGGICAGGWRALILETSPVARSIVESNPAAGLLPVPFSTNNLLGAIAGLIGEPVPALGGAWAQQVFDPFDPASVPKDTVPHSGWPSTPPQADPPPPASPVPPARDAWPPAPAAVLPAPEAESSAAQWPPPDPRTTAPAWETSATSVAQSATAPARAWPEPTEPAASGWPVATPAESWGTAPTPTPDPWAEARGWPPGPAPTSWPASPEAQQAPPAQSWGQAGWGNDWAAPAPQEPAPLAGAPAQRPDGPRNGLVIAVTVPKGGAGKTSLSVNLGAYLGLRTRPAGRRICIVDANWQQPDISHLITTYTPNIASLVRHQEDMTPARIGRHLVQRDDIGTAFLLGPATVDEANPFWINPRLYTNCIEILRQLYDYIIVDTPVAEKQRNDFSEFILPVADYLLVAVNPHFPTILNTDKWLRAICQPTMAGGDGFDAARVGIVLNRQEDGINCDEADVRAELATWRFLGSIPESTEWKRAGNTDGDIVVTHNYAELNAAFAQILYAITGEPELREPDAQAATSRRSTSSLLASIGQLLNRRRG